jgi:hypothetical protein
MTERLIFRPSGEAGRFFAQALVVVLEQCKNDLSRANIMAQAANLKNVSLSLLLPGITLNHLAGRLSSDQGRLYGRVPRQPVDRDQRFAAGRVVNGWRAGARRNFSVREARTHQFRAVVRFGAHSGLKSDIA